CQLLLHSTVPGGGIEDKGRRESVSDGPLTWQTHHPKSLCPKPPSNYNFLCAHLSGPPPSDYLTWASQPFVQEAGTVCIPSFPVRELRLGAPPLTRSPASFSAQTGWLPTTHT
uniref:Uncharacterized protein n=1 Tax=Sus scrofa TaxID=9823 RepID=A0A8D0STA4_PIG